MMIGWREILFMVGVLIFGLVVAYMAWGVYYAERYPWWREYERRQKRGHCEGHE